MDKERSSLSSGGNSIIKISMMNGDTYNYNQAFNPPMPNHNNNNNNSDFSTISSLTKSSSTPILSSTLPNMSTNYSPSSLSKPPIITKGSSRNLLTSIPSAYTLKTKSRSNSINSNAFDDNIDSYMTDEASEIYPQSSSTYYSPTPSPVNAPLVTLKPQHGQNHGRFVSGAQFRLLSKNTSVCNQCESNEKIIKKLKETIRSLKSIISRHEETLKHLKINSGQSDLSFPITQPLPSVLNPLPQEPQQPEVQEKIPEVKQEPPKANPLPATTGRVGSDPSFLTNEISKLKKQLNEEKEQAGIKYAKLLNESNELEATIEKLKEEIEEKNKAANAMKSTLDVTENRLRDTQNRLARSEAARDELEKKLNELHNSIIKNLEAEMKKNEETYLKNLEKIQNNLKSKELHAQQLEKNLSDTRTSRDNLVTKLQYIQEDVLVKKDAEIESNKQLVMKLTNTVENNKVDMAFKDKQIEMLENDKKNLQKKITFLEDQYNKLLEEMKNNSENNLKALQKSIAGSIKLCVVAPTVNVHLSNSDDKWKFKSEINKEKLKNFLDTEIFTQYSFLFKQETDKSSPLGPNPNLEVWLQKLLSQMQNTIENHVQSAVNGASL